MSANRVRMIVDEPTCLCDELRCRGGGSILIFQKMTVNAAKGELQHLRKIGSKCWNHFTRDLMELPDYDESPRN